MKCLKYAALAVALMAVAPTVTLAQDDAAKNENMARQAAAAAPKYAFSDLRGLGAGLIIIGAALGIGGLTKSAVESMARQPEMAGDIRTAMLISAALIEGVTFFALVIVGAMLKAY
jgi:F-type H+-transporting ATPase subunit c